MTAKEYLSQAFHLNLLINSDLEQIAALNALATKANATITNTPVQTSPEAKMEKTIIKILDLQEELKQNIQKLLTLKQEIRSVIGAIDNDEFRALLELRYLSSKRWEEIAVIMGYSIEHIYHMHRDALREVRVP